MSYKLIDPIISAGSLAAGVQSAVHGGATCRAFSAAQDAVLKK